MNSNVAQIRDKLAGHFQGVEQVNDTVLRFTRSVAQHPYAVYYVDVSDHLPETPAELTRYQDSIIGKYYFDGAKSLQWSNYLYFVLSNAGVMSMKDGAIRQLIEQDRTYARKFVVSEQELESAVRPLTLARTDATPETNILSVWTNLLSKAGIEKAVISDESLPKRLALIEKSSGPVAKASSVAVGSPITSALPQLRSLALTKYRAYPKQRSFEFGTVNLIVGANGAGKTSLLEAIELLYCGRNKRNPDADETYELTAKFATGKPDKATSSRDRAIFRERNLSWYGQSEIRTCNLYVSFAQFNFLDTDAAVSLAESVKNLNEDLSKLLVGPQASKAWKEIERMEEAIAGKLRELRPLKEQLKSELADTEARIRSSQSVAQESDAIFVGLNEMLSQCEWRLPESDKNAAAASLIAPFSELESLAQETASVQRAESPISIASLRKFCEDAAKIAAKANTDIVHLDEMRRKEQPLVATMKRLQLAFRLVGEAERFAAASLPSRLATSRQQQTLAATTGNAIATVDDNTLAQLKTAPLATVAAFCQTASLSASAAEKARTAARNQHKKFTDLRNKSLNLAQQLRDIAAELLAESPDPDRCPLCNTQFEPGQLQYHIHRDVDASLEQRAQTLLSQVRTSDEQYQTASIMRGVATTLATYCKKEGIADSTSTSSVVERIENARKTLDSSRLQVAQIEKEISALRSQGLSEDRMNELLAELNDAGYSLAEWTQAAIDTLKGKIAHDTEANEAAVKEHRRVFEEAQRVVAVALQVSSPEVAPLKQALSKLKEDRSYAWSLLERLNPLLKQFPWRSDRSLAELRLAVDSIRSVAAELQAAVTREQQAKTLFNESGKKKDELSAKIAELDKRLKRFTDAHAAIETLISKHSLSGAMSSALQRNRTSIESIFGRIHSPAEFTGLGKDFGTLIRKTGSAEAKLSQVSTGQRAAFALSIFLAQNAQLRSAPPLLLIDDPIAHVDDLNSLSFLDFLRDLTLTGNRQIFFSTANEKLATLFERKFDFLGEDGFKRYDLRR